MFVLQVSCTCVYTAAIWLRRALELIRVYALRKAGVERRRSKNLFGCSCECPSDSCVFVVPTMTRRCTKQQPESFDDDNYKLSLKVVAKCVVLLSVLCFCLSGLGKQPLMQLGVGLLRGSREPSAGAQRVLKCF